MAKKKMNEKLEIFSVSSLLEKYIGYVNDGEVQFLLRSQQNGIIGELKTLKAEFFDEKNKEKKVRVDWHKAHKIGRELWRDLASYALNDIDPNSKGNSKLFKYLGDATKFEDLLYGLDDYYRDHTLHSLWVYILGEYLLREKLTKIHEGELNWYLFNDIKRDKDKFKYDPALVAFSEIKKENINYEVNDHKDAIWCVIALCHDLGYSLAKLDRLNDRVQKVLKYFDMPDFERVGYSLNIEHQYLMSQFLELMAMDVRIEPGEDYDKKIGSKDKKKCKNMYIKWKKLKKPMKEDEVGKYKEDRKNIIDKISKDIKEKVLIKCYRDDSTYWRLCRAMEKKEHGILSSYLIYKILGIFAESSVRGPAEKWGLDEREAKRNIIRGDILFAIAQHEFDFAHLNELGSLADLLIVCDELEEFSRYGRELVTREYYETTAETSISFDPVKKGGDVEPGKDIKINMAYFSKHKKPGDFLYFFYRKATRLCSIYSLKLSPEDGEEQKKEKENYCTITSIEMKVAWKPDDANEAKKEDDENGVLEIQPDEGFLIRLSNESEIYGELPKCVISDESDKKEYEIPKEKGYIKGNYKLRSYDDELRVIGKYPEKVFGKEIPLKKWLGIKDETS